jgi:hypothetical protein
MVHKGAGENTSAKWENVQQLFKSHGVRILDDSALPKMAKIDVPDKVSHLVESMKEEWNFYPEKKYKVPTTRRSIKK